MQDTFDRMDREAAQKENDARLDQLEQQQERAEADRKFEQYQEDVEESERQWCQNNPTLSSC